MSEKIESKSKKAKSENIFLRFLPFYFLFCARGTIFRLAVSKQEKTRGFFVKNTKI
jgi:hypothetical protein